MNNLPISANNSKCARFCNPLYDCGASGGVNGDLVGFVCIGRQCVGSGLSTGEGVADGVVVSETLDDDGEDTWSVDGNTRLRSVGIAYWDDSIQSWCDGAADAERENETRCESLCENRRQGEREAEIKT